VGFNTTLLQIRLFSFFRGAEFQPFDKEFNPNKMDSIMSSTRFKAVTKSDTAMQTYATATVTGAEKPITIMGFKAIYVGGAGDLTVKNDAGASIAFQNVPAGSLLPISGTYIMAATTATNLVALF